ncbi:MAG: MarR family transcriptional regulator [Notoacmeibacter sp.]|nr:MarR family transcriptional regulator [Notoacmeibacter sp.]
MAKIGKGQAAARIQSVARLLRTDLAGRLLAHGLYAGQDQIMLALAEGEQMTPGQLAQKIGVKPPTVTKTINRLQAQGFVAKSGSETDARVAHVTLTDAGREALKVIEKSVKRNERAALRGFDKKDRKALMKLLARVEANLGLADAASGEAADGDDEG